MNIYAETNELVAVRRAMEADDIPVEAILDTIESMSGDFSDKVVAVYQASEEIDLDVEMLDKMISDLQARKQTLKKRQGNMRQAITDAMATTGINQIKCPYFTISLKRKPDVLEVFDVDALPDDLVSVKTTITPDKAAIKKAIKDGVSVDGAKMAEAGKTIQIRR